MRARVPARKMVAIYDYNPHELSPNVDVEVPPQFTLIPSFSRFVSSLKRIICYADEAAHRNACFK